MKTVLQAAVDNWPEDEAYGLFCTFSGRLSESPEEADEIRKAFVSDCARMETFFAKEADAADLVARFRAELAKLLSR